MTICDKCRWRDEIVGPVAMGEDETMCWEKDKEECLDYDPDMCASMWQEEEVKV